MLRAAWGVFRLIIVEPYLRYDLDHPQSLLAPDAYLKLAQAHASLVDGPYYDQAATKESITYFTDFMLLFPSDANVGAAEKGLDGMKTMLAESKMKIGDFYFYKRNNFTAAKVFYNEAITAYPESEIAKRAKFRLADVEATAKPLHVGRTTIVVDTELRDAEGKLVARVTQTQAVLQP